MFKNPFSFNGRIRRLEYVFSLMIAIVVFGFGNLIFSPIDLEGEIREIKGRKDVTILQRTDLFSFYPFIIYH